MSGHYDEHEQHFLFGINRELTELYASMAIRNFALSLIVIFEPIYLYLFFERSLPHTLIYFGLAALFTGLAAPFGAKIVARIGIKHTMLLSVPFIFIYYIGLWQINTLGIFVYLLPVVLALYRIFYWTAFHIDFARFSNQGKRGREISYRAIIVALVAGAAPILGGILIVQYGFAILFGMILTLLFASTVPLFLSREVHEKYSDSYLHIFREIFRSQNRSRVLAFVSEGFDTRIQQYIWPIYLFIIAISFEVLGIIMSASMILGIVTLFFVGRASDKFGPRKLLKVGGVLNAVIWPIKIFVRTPIDAFLAQVIHGSSRALAYIPFSTIFYDWAGSQDDSRDRFVIFREIVLNVSGALMLFALAFIFIFTDKIFISFVVAALVAPGILFMAKNYQSKTPQK